jgi:KDO2-lipid IV(A) lauroyltransferase
MGQSCFKKAISRISIEILSEIIYVDTNRSIFIISRFFMASTSFKKIKYWFGDLLGNLLLTCSIVILRLLHPRGLVFIARILGTMAFYLIKKYRDRVISNLSLALMGEKSLREMSKLAKEIFFNFTLTPLETLYAYIHPFDRFLLKIQIQGKEYLESALAQKNGVIALGAHLGPFTLVGARLALEGYAFNLIVNEGTNFPKLWKRLGDYQRDLGQKLFPPKPASVSVKKSLNSLRRNEILYLVADEQQILGGLPVPFFGQTAYTPPGPAIFSLKTGAPILPMFIVREKGIPRTLFIRGPIEIERTSDEKKNIELLTAKFTKAIEDIIRQYPGQWPWLNRRWKSPYRKASLDMGNQGV